MAQNRPETRQGSNMSESFAELFEESLKENNLKPGAVVTGVVESIDDEWITVNAGLKSFGVIPRKEFVDDGADLGLEVGDSVDVAVVSLEDGQGNTLLSRFKARQMEAWTALERAFEAGEVVKGVITGQVRGGLTVELGSVRAFLPGSLVDMRPLRDTSHLEGQEFEFKLIKLDAKRNNVVVSRRAVLEQAYSADREKLLAQLAEGAVLDGVVKNITDYGAFIDLGGIDGLLHITDIAWRRVKHPSDVLSVGEDLKVKVLKYDAESKRVSLGLKQLGEDPWASISERYPANTKLTAKVTNITDYGCFAQLEQGIEGLVHVSEMDWTNKNVHPSRVVALGDEIDVMVLDVDVERRRISLGMKQCIANPWEAYAAEHNKGDRVTGTIKSITDFGLFIGLDGGIDGLVHVSDLSWDMSTEEAAKQFSKGQEVEALILSIDTERERISLGIKQLDGDPFMGFVSEHPKSTVVDGQVVEVDNRVAIVELAEGVTAVLKASEFSQDRTDKLQDQLKPGDPVNAAILSVDKQKRQIFLSVNAKVESDNRAAMKAMKDQQSALSGPTTIGELIKQKMEKDD
ncbi:MAG: 30S ribosomal protein S1 [Motiliproteus sp.]|nr:30S ribosomal protein S1 [Motiliproteus sp.]